ncbi:hypothetical protein DL95DRAFT_500141, partial [Leptodontidium sp. 2 PMI_412]
MQQWVPTQLLIHRFEGCVWQSGRDAQFSSIYGRMWRALWYLNICMCMGVCERERERKNNLECSKNG